MGQGCEVESAHETDKNGGGTGWSLQGPTGDASVDDGG